MNILLVSTYYKPHLFGGAERAVTTLAQALRTEGAHVSVLTLTAEPSSVEEVDGVTVFRQQIANVYYPNPSVKRHSLARVLWHARDAHLPEMAKVIRSLIRQERFDVVNTHTVAGFSTSIWHAVRAEGIPLLHTIHDYYLLCKSSTLFRNGAPCVAQCAICRSITFPRRRGSEHLDHVTSVSDAALRIHRQAGYFRKARTLRTIRNSFPPCNPLFDARTPRRKGSLCFGYLGRLDPTKGVQVLLDAARFFPAGTECRIAGTGPDGFLTTLREQAADLSITFVGHTDTETFLASIDVLIVPSLWPENAPLVVHEAFAAGVPVIASRVGGLPELVSESRTGLLVPPGEPAAIVDAVMRLGARGAAELKAMSAACRATALTRPPSVMARDYLTEYVRCGG